MSTQAGTPVPIAASATDQADVRAAAFLATYGGAFGIAGPAWGRVERVTGPDDVGMERVRYRQLHAGIPVTAGEMSIHLKGAGVVAVHAKTLVVKDKIKTTPSFSADEAAARAKALMDKHFPGMATRYGARGSRYSTAACSRSGRRRPVSRGSSRPRATPSGSTSGSTPIRACGYSTSASSRTRMSRRSTTATTTPRCRARCCAPKARRRQPATPPARTSTSPTTSRATRTTTICPSTGATAIDGHGMPLISTVRHCERGCPYENAFWNGVQMVYGHGFAPADDVVAHELTHAVTELSAGLFYYMQSGALNESFSDIFGETVDLLNGRGNDRRGVRWLIGEDSPIGAIRDMMNPNQFGDPGKLSDPQFVCAASEPTDQGGVHINSGVPNHAYALMVDGGTYNGFTISGIGLIKAGKIQYRALTTYLLSASNFLDNYNALKQSCADLTPGVMTAADCARGGQGPRRRADGQPLAVRTAAAGVGAALPGGPGASNVFFDNLENTASGNWAISNLARRPELHWFYPGPPNPFEIGPFATSGVQQLLGVRPADSSATPPSP